jgi:adenylate cyclase
MPRILIIGPEGRQEVELLSHNTLGRHPSNTVQVLDRIVSKEHCHIDLVDGRYVLRDLGSLNGTFVNGERVSEKALGVGDEILLGSTRVIFDSGALGPPTLREGSGAPALVTAPPTAFSDRDGSSDPLGTRSSGPASHTGPLGPSAWNREGAETPLAPHPTASSERRRSRVTIAPGMVESHIRSKLAPLADQTFLPERLVQDPDVLRRDYEKLRVGYELQRAIGVELDIDRALEKILDAAFQLLPADRGVVLLYDELRQLAPRCVRTRAGHIDPNEDVLISSTIVDQVLRDRTAVLSSDATVDSRFQGAHSIIMQGIRSSMAVPLLHSGEVFGVMMLDSQIATNAFTEKDLQLFQNVANQAAVSIQNSLYAAKLEQEAVTRERFRRLLSPAIAQQVIEGRVEIRKGGELRTTTVLFSDIRGFTAMSESQPPSVVVDMLNEYFERMVEVIFKHEGTLDKFVGDEIMALFGAPVGHTDDALRAVWTALEMKAVLADFNRERLAAGVQEINIGIGINTGECVAGYLGSSKALEYTVIGDTVNTGSRLCSVAKAGQIIISQNTFALVRDYVDVEELPPSHVKGKSQALSIYNVLGHKPVA